MHVYIVRNRRTNSSAAKYTNSHVNKSKREKHNGPSRLALQIRSSNELNQINCILRGYEYTTQYFIR